MNDGGWLCRVYSAYVWKALGCTALLCGVATGAAYGQSFPLKPVRIIVPFAAGGPSDGVSRAFAGKFAEMWGQQVLIDSRGGANTIVGAELAAKAPADGYTLFVTTPATLVNNMLLYRKLPYDARKSFALISMTAILPYAIIAHPALPVKSIKDLVALARARPGEVTYSSSGTGSSGHLAGVLFDAMTGTRMVHVGYKGAAPAVVDLLAGQVLLNFGSMASSGTYVKAGRLKVLAMAMPQRHPSWPEIPTVAEAGYRGYEMTTWFGFAAPAGTPRAIIDRVHAATVRVAAMPDVAERLALFGFDVITNTPEEFAAFVERDYARVEKAVRASGIRLD